MAHAPRAIYPGDPDYKRLMQEAKKEYERLMKKPKGNLWPLGARDKSKKHQKKAPSM